MPGHQRAKGHHPTDRHIFPPGEIWTTNCHCSSPCLNRQICLSSKDHRRPDTWRPVREGPGTRRLATPTEEQQLSWGHRRRRRTRGHRPHRGRLSHPTPWRSIIKQHSAPRMQQQPKLSKPPERQEKPMRQPRPEPHKMPKSCKKPERHKRNWLIRRLRPYKRRKKLERPPNRHRTLK